MMYLHSGVSSMCEDTAYYARQKVAPHRNIVVSFTDRGGPVSYYDVECPNDDTQGVS